VKIQAGDFPTQDATIVRVVSDISGEPSSVELSLRKDGSRMQAFTIENRSQQKIVARLSPKAYIGDLADWISFRPDVIELEPGQKRKVFVARGSKRDFLSIPRPTRPLKSVRKLASRLAHTILQ